MDYFPLFVRLNDSRCLVVGGGPVALRKVRSLCKAHAKISVVAPVLCDGFQQLPPDSFNYQQRVFEFDDIRDCRLIVAATDSAETNRRIAQLCHDANQLVCVVDDMQTCSAIFPSVVDRSPVVVALSTGGASPVLSRLLRSQLENLLPKTYGKLATMMRDYRAMVKQRLTDVAQRRKFWEAIVQGPIAEMLFTGRERGASTALKSLLENCDDAIPLIGEVYLVGAGPGDPELLTIRAMRLLQQADVVVYDRLVAVEILERVREDAEKIYVGKQRAEHSVPQGDINALLVRLAKEGKRVLRLKGGDPFIFGRGGEEIEALIDEKIPFQVVPGITAASGCATYAGIPLTHRDYSQACIFVTGHLKNNTVDLNWPMLAHAQQTVVFYMGLQSVNVICAELIAHGREEKTPAALIQQGTTNRHRALTGTLSSLPGLVANSQIEPPTLIIVGEVVGLQEKLCWFWPEDDSV